MPPLAEIRQQQMLDPDIAPLFKYHALGKKHEYLDTAKTKYRREAPFTLLNNGILYCRALIGFDDTIAHSLLLPDCLISRVLHALHDAVDCGHPEFGATYDVVRERCFWKDMYTAVKKHLDNCDPCR